FAEQQLRSNARVVVHGVAGEPDLGAPVPTPPAPATQTAAVESINPDEPWRKEPPKPAAAKTPQLPVPISFTLANGFTVLVNERPGLPIVSALLILKTGSDTNPVDKPGLANFTAAMLDEGTMTRNALQIADEVAQLGGSLGTGSSMDSTQVTASSLKRTFPALLDLIADVARRPSFPADEIERQRASRLASLVQQRENPSAAANTAMFAALYGHNHAYGFTELGTEASNRAMTRDDLQKFWGQNFVPNNSALVVSGQITLEEVKGLAERAFGSWQAGTPARPALLQPATTTARVVFVDKPGAPQTQLRVASVGVPRSTPDYEALRVMNEALGGLFSSRINLNLREQHGYTYGASSQFMFRRAAGPFLIASGVRTDVTAPAVGEIFKEVQRMRETTLTPDELNLAKDSLVRSLPSEFETSSRVTSSTATLFVYDLGLDYYTKFPARLAGVTADAVRSVAQKHVVPDRLLVVAAGDRAKIEPELQKLKLGAIEVRTPEGMLVSPTGAAK
ncbi:MAG: M16 family metallopeptidase, partial [Vicinamibacterales bacterium]